jgi:hypothetical protein
MDYKLLNGTAETQLLSTSMHKVLFKVRNKSKVAKTLLKLNRLGYLKDSTRNVHLRKDKQMSYCPNGRDTVLSDENPNKWTVTNRQTGRYGKVLKKLINEQSPNLGYKEKDIEELVNHIKSELNEGDFSLVSGSDIAHWYNGNRYNPEDRSSLNGSCMSDKSSEMFKIYTENPDVVKMLILVKDGKLNGRALLWNDKWLDRIYGHDHIITLFKKYAVERGWNYKAEQSYNNKANWIKPDGTSFSRYFSIDLNTDFDYFPYIDTFTYGGDGYLSNDCGSHDYCYESTGGDRGDGSGDDREWDFYDDCYIDSDNAVYLEDRGEYTHVDNACEDYITECWILSDNAVHVEDNGYTHVDSIGDNIVQCGTRYYDMDDTFFCEYSEEYYPNDGNDYVEIEGMIVHTDNEKAAYEDAGYTFDEEQQEWINNN